MSINGIRNGAPFVPPSLITRSATAAVRSTQVRQAAPSRDAGPIARVVSEELSLLIHRRHVLSAAEQLTNVVDDLARSFLDVSGGQRRVEP
jgi:hypothetical protein